MAYGEIDVRKKRPEMQQNFTRTPGGWQSQAMGRYITGSAQQMGQGAGRGGGGGPGSTPALQYQELAPFGYGGQERLNQMSQNVNTVQNQILQEPVVNTMETPELPVFPGEYPFPPGPDNPPPVYPSVVPPLMPLYDPRSGYVGYA